MVIMTVRWFVLDAGVVDVAPGMSSPLASRDSIATSLFATVLSKPLVGSSSSNTLGLVNSSTATETRLRSPPETPRGKEKTPPIIVFLHASKLKL